MNLCLRIFNFSHKKPEPCRRWPNLGFLHTFLKDLLITSRDHVLNKNVVSSTPAPCSMLEWKWLIFHSGNDIFYLRYLFNWWKTVCVSMLPQHWTGGGGCSVYVINRSPFWWVRIKLNLTVPPKFIITWHVVVCFMKCYSLWNKWFCIKETRFYSDIRWRFDCIVTSQS